MAFTLTVRRGYTAVPGVRITTADFNAGFLPIIEVAGSVGESEIQNNSVRISHLKLDFHNEGVPATTLNAGDLVMIGVPTGPYNRTVTVVGFLGLGIGAAELITEVPAWDANEMLLKVGTSAKRISVVDLMESIPHNSPLIAQLQDWAVNSMPVFNGDALLQMKTSNLAKALITQAGVFTDPDKVNVADEVLVVDVSAGVARKINLTQLGSAVETTNRFVSPEFVLPTALATKGGEVSHLLSALPTEIQMYLRCAAPGGANGYQENEVIPSSLVHVNDSQNDYALYHPVANASTVYCTMATGLGDFAIQLTNRDTGIAQPFDSTQWRGRLVARK